MTSDTEPSAGRPKAFSYLRFSSPEQMKGHSFQRQWEATLRYAERHGLDLDRDLTFHDLGVSAFRGANAERGKLALFRRAVEDGRVPPGSYLLVEDFDRLSRMDPWDAFPIFQEILNSGITIVTLKDERVWNREGMKGNLLRFMEPLFRMWGGHDENAKKSKRLLAFHEDKRRRVAAGEAVERPYKYGPLWLRWECAERRWDMHPERAATVRHIFVKLDEGDSPDKVARDLNASGVPTWERGKRAKYWRGARIRRIATNRAAVGDLVMHVTEYEEDANRQKKRRDKFVGVREGHYPAVVERDVFERVNARLGSTAARGRNASKPITSLVAGLSKCGRCGDSVIRVAKGGGYVYLCCSRAHNRGGCERLTIRYQDVENALRSNAAELIADAPHGTEPDEIEATLRSLDTELSELKDDGWRLARELKESGSPTIRELLRATEKKIEAKEVELRTMQERRERLGQPFVSARLEALRTALTNEPFDVQAANRALRAAVERIVITPQLGSIRVHWRDSGRVSHLTLWTKYLAEAFSDKPAISSTQQAARC